MPQEHKETFTEEPLTPESELPESPSQPDYAAAAAALEAQLAEMKDQALRAIAEAENTRRRAQRDVEESSKYAVSAFARDLISVAENFVRAASAITPEAREKDPVLNTLAVGVDMTFGELLGVFERHGIRRLDPLGEKFDHNYHQAVAQVESAEKEPGTILQVLQAGYVLHDRLLRPAMVTVTKAQGAAKPLDTQA